jgi:hypothetical protein
MAWERKLTGNRRRKPTRNYSIVRKLRKKGQITEEFEVMLNSLPLEDVIALKLELANRCRRRLSLWIADMACDADNN